MKQGFIIAKNKQSKLFFSSLGSYDRPIWTDKLEEAASFHSDSVAHASVKKLWEHRHWSSKVVAISELEAFRIDPATHDKLPIVPQGETGDAVSPDDASADVDSHSEYAPDDEHDEHDEHDDPEDMDSDPNSSESETDHMDSDSSDSMEDQLSADSTADEDSDVDGDQGDEECPTCHKHAGQHEENCEMSMPVVSQEEEHTRGVFRDGEKVKWHGHDAEIIGHRRGETDFVVVRVGGLDRKVPYTEITKVTESIEGVNPHIGAQTASAHPAGERAGQARAGEHAWSNAKHVYVYLNGRKYDFENNAPAAILFIKKLTPDEQKLAKMVTESPALTLTNLPAGERAGQARAGEHAWSDPSQAKHVCVYLNGRKYDFKNNAAEAVRFMQRLTPDEQKLAKMVTESPTMPKRPGNDPAPPQENKDLIPNLTKPKVTDIGFDDPANIPHPPETDLTYATAMAHDEKVKIPGNVLAALKDSINVFRKAADYNNNRDDAQSSFCMTVTGALEELHDHISQGTVEGLKQAQIKMSSWMNPITTNIPDVVRLFVVNGGRQPTLKDMFDTKRGEALLKRASKGFGYKD